MPAFTPPAYNAVNGELEALTVPAFDAVDVDLDDTPPVGPALSAYSGVTNESGVAAPDFTTDVPVTVNGRFLPISQTVGGVTQTLVVKPGTP